jgi:hypothetical protein
VLQPASRFEETRHNKKKLPGPKPPNTSCTPSEYQAIDKVWQVLTDLFNKGELHAERF